MPHNKSSIQLSSLQIQCLCPATSLRQGGHSYIDCHLHAETKMPCDSNVVIP